MQEVLYFCITMHVVVGAESLYGMLQIHLRGDTIYVQSFLSMESESVKSETPAAGKKQVFHVL